MSQNNLFDQFRESANEYESQPSRHAWRKLEGRLDAHESKGISSLYRNLAMAAAVVALVAFTFVVSLLMQNHKINSLRAEVTDLQDLEVYTDVTRQEAYQIVEFTRQHTSRLSNPISEGHPGKELRVTSPTEEATIRPAVVLGSKKAAIQKALLIKSDNFERFNELLNSKAVQTFFEGEEVIFIFKTESLCEAINCEDYQLATTTQRVFFAEREDIFMYNDPKHLIVEALNEGTSGKIRFDYSLKAKM